MERQKARRLEYLDLEEIDEKANIFLLLSGASEAECLSREERFDRWLDQVDR